LLKDRKLRVEELDRHARYLAIRVICKLDPFVSECCEIAGDEGAPDASGCMTPEVDDPTISFPENVDWRSIKPDLMYRLLGLANSVDDARRSIGFAWEIAGPPEYSEFYEERKIQYGELGLDALALADEIREDYKIPQRSFGDRHPNKILEDALMQVKKQRQESQARQAELMASL
jgi:hypothetical protein